MPISVLKTRSASQQFNVQTIETVTKLLYAVSPYVKSKDPQVRMKVAKTVTSNILKALSSKQKVASSKIVDNWVRRQAEETLQRTYNQRGDNAENSTGPGNSFDPSNIDKKNNPRSRYDFNNCVQRKQADGMPTDEAVLECNEELGGKSTMGYTDSNTTKNAQDKKSDCISKLKSQGIEASSIQRICDTLYADEDNLQKGSAKSAAKDPLDSIWIGQNSRMPDVNNEPLNPPAWSYAAFGGNPPRLSSGNNFRSASEVPKHIYETPSIADIFEMKRNDRESARIARENASIKSAAAKRSKIPAWAICSGDIDV